jgi:hypothetical protein
MLKDIERYYYLATRELRVNTFRRFDVAENEELVNKLR